MTINQNFPSQAMSIASCLITAHLHGKSGCIISVFYNQIIPSLQLHEERHSRNLPILIIILTSHCSPHLKWFFFISENNNLQGKICKMHKLQLRHHITNWLIHPLLFYAEKKKKSKKFTRIHEDFRNRKNKFKLIWWYILRK